ncbi:UvrD-helicase domain-containing protein [Crossiella cryophila]|uniref:DNA 3'-5' helicase n=1 Tax=Crossiella cryophila TaxID=43355 RepID=A0A7W7C8I3_9PSEU|nr:UvrD-helicase domain-containing protein [Crossiella cryophila]MBB4676466.1 superfamily I DNA/RNA helicase [Crossiella cryophila]
MATVVLAKELQKNLAVDGSLKPRAWDLLSKLMADQDLTGLDLKIPKGARDPRVRTARVTDNHRAVLFAIGSDADQYYLLVAIRPHDDAYRYAAQITTQLNPTNGVLEVLRDLTPAPPVPLAPERTVADDRRFLVPFLAAELKSVGIMSELAERAVQIRDVDELLKLCETAPRWQSNALLDLADGKSLEEVRSSYSRPEGKSARQDVPTDASNPDQLRDSLSHFSSRMEFVVVEGDEHLRRMLQGDFAAWRLFLHPEQRRVVEKDRNGPYRVTGGAGTGKTIVALHRAAELAKRNPAARVLLTTFTKNLAHQLKAGLRHLADPDTYARIEVCNIDQLVRDVVGRATGDRLAILREKDERRYWENAVANVPDLSAKDRAVFTPYFLASEHKQVVLGMANHDKHKYLEAYRRGRVSIDPSQKLRVWRIVDEFRRLLSVDKCTTWALTAARAAAIAQSSDRPVANTYDHVVVDEGQDLSPAHWRLLRAVVASGPNDLFICEDAHQRIYGERVVLSKLGIETRGRSQRLTLNYRTTKQVLKYATQVLVGETFQDMEEEEESTRHYRSLLAGPDPKKYPAHDWDDEKRYIVQTVKRWLVDVPAPAPDSLAVLVPDGTAVVEVIRALERAGVPVTEVNENGPLDPTSVQVATMHRAKGTEFARCIVADVQSEKIPLRWTLEQASGHDQADIERKARSLLYVACTRARDQLVITWAGEPSRYLPSEIQQGPPAK